MVKLSLKVDQPRPGHPARRKRRTRAQAKQRFAGGQCVGVTKLCQFGVADLFERNGGTAPLLHPLPLIGRISIPGHGGIIAGWSRVASMSPFAYGYNDTVEFRLDRTAFVVTTKDEDTRTHRALAYWLTRPADERVAAVEFLRRQFIGPGARLQRVLRVTSRPPR